MATQPDRKKYLERQIEFIRDTERRKEYEVVVKVHTSDQADPKLITNVLEALRKRGVSSSARDVLPVESRWFTAASQGRRAPRAAAAKLLHSEVRSLAAQSAQAAVSSAAKAVVRQQNIGALQYLLKSDVAKEAAILTKAKRKTKQLHEPTSFWTSSSAVLRVRDNQLSKLITAAPNIQDIFLNQQLRLPPVVVPKQLPHAVEDNKVSSWGIRMIGALSAWGAYGAKGKGVTVGLLDTGVDARHPDLKGKIAKWAEFDANGMEVPNSKPYDSDEHGTHCAGTIVGGRASGRWIGVAPEAKIAAALVLKGKQGGTHAQILAGIEWAINSQVDVISMSLGGLILGPDSPSTYTQGILSALRAGIPVVTAIGNDGSQTTGSPGNDILAFAVGATDYNNRAAGFSGGRTQVIRQSEFFRPDQLPLVYSKPDVSAPGVAIYSSIPGQGKKKWEYLNGTSMATPHVAGAIALLLSATKIKSRFASTDRAFLIQDLLTGSAEELGEAGQNHRFGFGRIDVLRALGFAEELGYF
jgi:subtilisin family serine protease